MALFRGSVRNRRVSFIRSEAGVQFGRFRFRGIVWAAWQKSVNCGLLNAAERIVELSESQPAIQASKNGIRSTMFWVSPEKSFINPIHGLDNISVDRSQKVR